MTQPEPASEISEKLQLNVVECPVCDVTFDSLIKFQNHCLSSEHAQMVIKKESANSLLPNIVSSSGNSNNNSSSRGNTAESVDGDRILPETDIGKSQTQSFATCKVCKKFFNGPESYKQHVVSPLHKRNVEFEKNVTAGHLNNSLGEYFCEPCKKRCSGQVPYDQHMNGEPHKKKMRSLQYSAKSISELESAPVLGEPAAENNIDKGQKVPWFCDVCNKPCTGPVPYAQHLAGITHRKNVDKAERKKNLSKPNDSIHDAASSKGIEEKSDANGSEFIDGCTNFQQTDESNLNLEKTFVLSEFVGTLGNMSSAELQESIKKFLPDNSNDFDKADSRNSATDKNTDVSDKMPVEDDKKSGIDDKSE